MDENQLYGMASDYFDSIRLEETDAEQARILTYLWLRDFQNVEYAEAVNMVEYIAPDRGIV